MTHAVETMAYSGETPWHGLGVQVPPDISPRDMMKRAGLDWKVRKSQLFFRADKPSDDRTIHQIQDEESDDYKPVRGTYENKFALYRDSDGKFLDIVHSKRWEPVQNHQAFEFFDEFVRRGDMQMETAGSLNDGKRVFVLARVKDGFSLTNGRDDVDSYLLFSNPHVYGEAINVRFTPIRVVCQNTLAFALNLFAKHSVRAYHSVPFNELAVKEVLGIARIQLHQYHDIAEYLSRKRYSKPSLEAYLKEIFPVKEPHKALTGNALRAYEITETQPGANYSPGSFWNAFNAVTFLTDHKLGRTADSRLTSAWFGENRRRKERALKLACDYAKAA